MFRVLVHAEIIWRTHGRNRLRIEGSDSIFSDNFSIYSESSSSDEDEQNERSQCSFFSVRRRKSRSEKSISSSKQAAKKTKTKRSANVLNDDQTEE